MQRRRPRPCSGTLVTKQTGEAGKEVSTIYFNEATDIEKEYYLAILMDRATSQPVIIASTEGGMDIEEVAEKTPEKILKVLIDPTLGIRPYQARQVAFGLELKGDSFKQCVKLGHQAVCFFLGEGLFPSRGEPACHDPGR